jgi:hypothetical protein
MVQAGNVPGAYDRAAERMELRKIPTHQYLAVRLQGNRVDDAVGVGIEAVIGGRRSPGPGNRPHRD